jgi:hypothetical protein
LADAASRAALFIVRLGSADLPNERKLHYEPAGFIRCVWHPGRAMIRRESYL